GADAKEVERGLKSESRIGEKAYLAPGPAIAGGTLLRDVTALAALARGEGLFPAVIASNRAHAGWPYRKLRDILGTLRGKTVGVLGLAYKPGTDVVRRSSAVELCAALAADGASVRAHDPKVTALPAAIAGKVASVWTMQDAWRGADALVVATPWPEYRAIDAPTLAKQMRQPVVIDAFGALAGGPGKDARIRYFTVGAPAR
ncbi:MAG TPA: UDP binding domain-containing protein, partial [Planctomycetota bacterium]|nr:UDP binding domain-containing protein [Planctomycetota bacterium]